MLDVEAVLAKRPSAFEDAFRTWLERPARAVQFIPADSDRPFFLDVEPHGRKAADPPDPADRELPVDDEGSAEGELPSGDDAPPGVASFAGLLERGADALAAAKAAHLRQCEDAADLAGALAAFAAARPAAMLDRPDGEAGAAAAASRAARPEALTKISEWAVDEVMVALGLSSPAASRLLAESVSLAEQLPATLAALKTGTISWAHARMLVEVLAPLSDDAKRAEVEARLLARAANRTVAQLRVSARRAVLRADAAAATRRLAAAIRDRQVRVFPGKDGMGSWVATMTAPVALACHNALRQYAESCKVPGDERTLDQRMVDCLADLILRPGETGLPPVQAQLTVVTSVDTLSGGDEPGEVDGHPVPASVVRELAYALSLLPRPDAEVSAAPPEQITTAEQTTAPEQTTTREATGGQTTTAETPSAPPGEVSSPTELPPGETVADEAALSAEAAVDKTPEAHGSELPADEAAAARIAQLLGLTTVAGTALAHLPAIAVTDAISGQLLALTTAAGLRAAATCSRRTCRTGKRPCPHAPDGPVLGPPPTTPGYRPSVPMQRFVAARDRRCRFPGCRTPAIRCDLDHTMPWPAGATSADNLCCLCRHHHRLSHQAPGWTLRRLPDGCLEWTTPGGDRITTDPPRYGTDDVGPPGSGPVRKRSSQSQPLDPPLTARERVLGRPHPPGYVDDDPAPF